MPVEVKVFLYVIAALVSRVPDSLVVVIPVRHGRPVGIVHGGFPVQAVVSVLRRMSVLVGQRSDAVVPVVGERDVRLLYCTSRIVVLPLPE